MTKAFSSVVPILLRPTNPVRFGPTLSFYSDDVHYTVRHRKLEKAVQANNTQEVCARFQEFAFVGSGVEMFHPFCDCTGDNTTGYDVSCALGCTVDIDGKEVFYSVSTSLQPGPTVDFELGVNTTRWQECYQFVAPHFDGEDICFATELSSTHDDFRPQTVATINGQTCKSIEWMPCWGPLVDCSNLGYGASMNFCNGSGIEANTSFATIYGMQQSLPEKNASDLLGSCDNKKDLKSSEGKKKRLIGGVFARLAALAILPWFFF